MNHQRSQIGCRIVNAIVAGSALDEPFGVHRADAERVPARGEARVVHGAQLARRAPIPSGAVEFVLVAQDLAQAKAEGDEVNLQLVAIRLESRQRHRALAQCRRDLRDARDSHRTDQGDGCDRRSLGLRHEPHETGRGAKPQHSIAVCERRKQEARSETVRGGEMLDAARRRIEAVDSLAAADVEKTVVILCDDLQAVARQPLSGRVRDENRVVGLGVIHANQSGALRRRARADPSGPDGCPGSRPGAGLRPRRRS